MIALKIKRNAKVEQDFNERQLFHDSTLKVGAKGVKQMNNEDALDRARNAVTIHEKATG